MKIICLIISFVFAQWINAQTTYTWNVASGNFLTPNSWTPARTTPSENDVLVFDGNIRDTAVVNNISTQTIGRLRVINGANVNFASSVLDTQKFEIKEAYNNNYAIGKNTFFKSRLRTNDILHNPLDTLFPIHVDTVYNDTLIKFPYVRQDFTTTKIFYLVPKLVIKNKSTITPSFEISGNSNLEFNCEKPYLSIIIDSGAIANIFGTVKFKSIRSNIFYGIGIGQRLIGVDSNSIIVKNGVNIRVENDANCQVFGLYGNKNVVLFDSGASFYTSRSTSLVVGYGYPYAIIKVKFSIGSNFILGQGGFDRGINYGNVLLNNEYGVVVLLKSNQTFPTLSNIINVENLTIASNYFAVSENVLNKEVILNIKGNLIIQNNSRFFIGNSYFPDLNGSTTINFNGTKPQTISGSGSLIVRSFSNSPVNFKFSNPSGITLNQNINLANSYVMLDTGFINLNGFNLNIGQDSINYGNLKVNKGFITGNGTLTKWYPANKTVTNNIDSTLFPFGTSTQNRNLWVSGNFTQAGTLTVSHNNIAGFTPISTPFNDSLTNNLLVNGRQNYSWQLTKSASLKGTNLTIKAMGNLENTYVNLPTNTRLTLANSKAPGAFLSGTNTSLLPLATRINISDSNLNNTFYLGGFNNYCTPPPTPLANNASICNGKNTQLRAFGIGKIAWYSDSVAGTLLKTDSVFNTPFLNNNTNYYVQDSTCMPSARRKITVTVLPKPIVSIIANATMVCKGNSIILRGNGAQNYLWNNGVLNGISFTPLNSGLYNVIGADSNNCIDSAFINIEVKPLPNVDVIKNKNTITALLTGANYQWFNCTTKKNITSANAQSFTATSNGNYAVIVSQNGCSDTSVCININSVGINENDFKNFSVFPNPASNKLNIVFEGDMPKNITANIYDSKGSLIKSETLINNEIDINNLAQGLYLLTIVSEGKSYSSKFVKE